MTTKRPEPLDTPTEKPFPAGLSLVAEINREGVFTSVNDDFCAMYGYSRDALIGENYRLIRHPDTPRQLSASMRKTLGRNRPWQGIVKYRCRNGDYFWADVMIVPVRENDATAGYLSVCSSPRREAVARAEEQCRHLATSGAPAGPAVSLADFLSVKSGVIIGVVFVSLLMIVGGMLGIGGLKHANESVETLYRDQLKPALMIGRISFLMADNRSRIALALQELAHAGAADDPLAKQHIASRTLLLTGHAAMVERNKQEIAEIWTAFTRVPRHGHEAGLVRDYWAARQAYADEGLAKAIAALEKGNLRDAEQVFRERVNPLYDAAAERADRLLGAVKRNAESELRLMVSNNEMIRDIALFGIVGGLLAIGFSGGFFLLGVVRPLDQAVAQLERIANGNLNEHIELDGGGETGRLSCAIAIMQLRLKVIIDKIHHTSTSINAECAELNEATMAVVERYAEEHERIHHLLTAADRTHAEQKTEHAHANATLALAERVLNDQPPASVDCQQLLDGVREISASALLQTYVGDDTVRNLAQIAALVVDNRQSAQDTWSASEKMKQTAVELDARVKYFN